MSIGRCAGWWVLAAVVARASVTLDAGRQVSALDVADAKGLVRAPGLWARGRTHDINLGSCTL